MLLLHKIKINLILNFLWIYRRRKEFVLYVVTISLIKMSVWFCCESFFSTSYILLLINLACLTWLVGFLYIEFFSRKKSDNEI